MKKITCAMLMVAGMGASVSAFAATAYTSGETIDATKCALLSEGVTLNLSKAVHGAYNCDTVNTDIRLMTCHETGSNKSTNMPCAVVGFLADGTTPIWNNGATGQGACDLTAGYPIASYRIFAGDSKGGSVAPMQNTASCLTALPEASSFFGQY